jgi:hypothetical protein
VEESELIRKFFGTAFPNPDRVGCPDRRVLWAIATNTLPADDPARLHLASCSPCFTEVQDVKNQLQRESTRRRKRAIVVAASAAIVGVAIAGSILWTMRGQRQRSEALVRAPAAKSTRPSEAPEKQLQAKGSSTTPYELALDLRPWSRTRGEDDVKPPMLRVPARLLKLRLTLPLGSDDGRYDLEIRRTLGAEAVKASKGNATIRNGDTRIEVEFDLSDIPADTYTLLYRHADASWHEVAIVVYRLDGPG